MHAKCTVFLGLYLLLSCSPLHAANEEFPSKLHGWWGNSKETCDAIRTERDPAHLRDDAKWLQLTATNVLGSTQGRFFSEIPAQKIGGVSAELSFEMQSLDEVGTIVVLNLLAGGRLHETAEGTDFLFCSPALAGSEEFPQRMRGFWTDNKTTCDVFRTKGPAHLREDQKWLKISATDVLGSTQGRVLQERRPAIMVNRTPAELSFEVQSLKEPRLPAYFEDLTLSLDGRLYQTIVGARASGIFERCQFASPRGSSS